MYGRPGVVVAETGGSCRGDGGSCGETRVSYYNLVKVRFVKSMLHALFLSPYALNVLFVLIKCTVELIFRFVVR